MSLPERFWHCAVKPEGASKYTVANDLDLADLQRTIVTPWNKQRPFAVAGIIVRPEEWRGDIRIARTDQPTLYYAEQHNARMREQGVADMATDRRMLPLNHGEDHTFDLLFAGPPERSGDAELEIILNVCKRLPQVARVLSRRPRTGKASFDISDEYDVQDLLHATLRAYLKYSVQEDPLPKVGGSKSGRADVSIEELGILIELKYARGPADQKRIFEEFSQDLVLYAKWPHLRTLIFVIYNSADLRDPESFEKLSGEHEISGKRFKVHIVLA